MFETVTPESVGISSEKIYSYYKMLEKNRFNVHSILMAKGNNIFTEMYKKPFDANTAHRMYSETKSFVGIAVAELAAEGKISLDDKIVDYFPDKLPSDVSPYIKMQTIRHMLTMQTFTTGRGWLGQGVTDRLKHYFSTKAEKCPGTVFHYDSEGSFVLGALIERVTGMTFLDYLRKKCLNKIGFSKEAKCLKTPCGYAWSDSALICTPRDMLAFGRLIADEGEWNGEQLLDRAAVREAVKKQVDNCEHGAYGYDNFGYGYYIWRTYENGFAFIGMHTQFMIYNPKSDVIFVCTCGNFSDFSREIIIRGFFDCIAEKDSMPLPENPKAYEELMRYCEEAKLLSAVGEQKSDIEKEINGIKFVADNNDKGISDFELRFYDDGGELVYHNTQGEKTLKFGRCSNEFQKFPQTGYSGEVGGISCAGNMYDCAVSAAWAERAKLRISVQIIDEYIGNLYMTISFADEFATVSMTKDAEDFLNEYEGCITFKKELKK